MDSPSSPEKCSICLGAIENRSVIDGCLHAFCYSCLKEWSKVKAVCPLCKHSFHFFMFNIKANDDFDKYEVPKPMKSSIHSEFDHFQQNFIHWEHETNRVVDRWMSSRIYEWRERIQQDQENARAAIVAATSTDLIRRRRKYYRDGVQVSHVKNNKKIRDISSQFFRDNLPQTYRLVPWLKRELVILFGANNMMLVNRVCDLILSALPTLGINSVDFYNEIKPYFLERTDHFLKEFVSFASSPHDIGTYDRYACYGRSNRRRPNNPGSWSSDDDSPRPRYMLPHLYNTNLPEPPPLAHVRNRVSMERSRAINRKTPKKRNSVSKVKVSQEPTTSECIVISSSQSSDESEVEFVKFIKPPHQRTPDAFINLSSDEEEKPGPSRVCSTISPTEPSIANENIESQVSDSSDEPVKVKLKSLVIPVSPKPPGQFNHTSADDEQPTTSRRRQSSDRSRPNSSAREYSSESRPLRKIVERKRHPSHQAWCFSSYWSSSSDDDYATPYITSSRRFHRNKKRHKN